MTPFSVVQVSGPEQRWDPSSEKLALSYRINDPNGRAVSGRILYMIPVDPTAADDDAGRTLAVHRQALTGDDLTHGDHELPAASQWDGNISEGLDDKIGQDVTADLAPVGVIVEIWNTEQVEPGHVPNLGSGATDREGEYLARRLCEVPVEAIVEARWTTEWCIPWPQCEDPELDADHGRGEMEIRVRNVADGVPVRIKVARVNRIDDPGRDFYYYETGDRPARQPDLQEITVQEGRARRPDGSNPAVLFRAYSQHYTHPGNNFYCFYVAFGTRGNYMLASERDYENHEADCLHMRFTVFIHRPSGDLEEYTQYANALHRFLNSETRYFRSYLKTGGFPGFEEWLQAIAVRYAVVYLGHAAAGCRHADHPTRSDGRRKDLFGERFEPDHDHCPNDLPQTATRGGCGNRSHVCHQLIPGRIPHSSDVPAARRGKKVWAGNVPASEHADCITWTVEDFESTPNVSVRIRTRGIEPHVFFWNGGCRTILTTNLGEVFLGGRTPYYHGWTYSPACDYGRFCYDVFRRWIKGTDEEPAPDEFDPGRLVAAYLSQASRGSRGRYHPRITDASLRLSPNGPADHPVDMDAAETAMA